LLRDRDAIFGNDFRAHVRDMGIHEVLSTPRSPWQRAYVERVIGSVRRECLDHVIVLQERLAPPNPRFVLRLLSPIQNASFVGEGPARATARSAARNRAGRRGASGRWTAPPLRTTGRLKQPHSKAPLLKGLREICVRMVRNPLLAVRPRRNFVHRPVRIARTACEIWGLSLRNGVRQCALRDFR
jgi:hypothetical protein